VKTRGSVRGLHSLKMVYLAEKENSPKDIGLDRLILKEKLRN
jgi:hypothetical protein